MTPSNAAPGRSSPRVLVVTEQGLVQLGDVLEEPTVVVEPVVVEHVALQGRAATQDAQHPVMSSLTARLTPTNR